MLLRRCGDSLCRRVDAPADTHETGGNGRDHCGVRRVVNFDAVVLSCLGMALETAQVGAIVGRMNFAHHNGALKSIAVVSQ